MEKSNSKKKQLIFFLYTVHLCMHGTDKIDDEAGQLTGGLLMLQLV